VTVIGTYTKEYSLIHDIRSIVTIKEKPFPSEWFKSNGIGEGKIDYFHLSIEDDGSLLCKS
jgi:hypothetical protein